MSRPLEYSDEFVAAVREDLRRLADTDRLEWAALLQSDLRDLELLVQSFPRAGKLFERRGRRELRKLALRRTPFIVWYATQPDSGTAPVVFLRLFHVRQRSTRPRW